MMMNAATAASYYSVVMRGGTVGGDGGIYFVRGEGGMISANTFYLPSKPTFSLLFTGKGDK